MLVPEYMQVVLRLGGSFVRCPSNGEQLAELISYFSLPGPAPALCGNIGFISRYSRSVSYDLPFLSEDTESDSVHLIIAMFFTTADWRDLPEGRKL